MVPEPKLQFRYGQQLSYPRDGLYLFGPFDASRAPRHIRYGVIGTRAGVERFRRWAATVSHFIDVPPPGPLSKQNAIHHVAFPGFAEAFHASWDSDPIRVIDDIEPDELLKALRIENRHEAVKTAVDMYVERLQSDQRREEDQPSFWYVVIPEFVFQFGRPKAPPPAGERVKGKVHVSLARAKLLARAPTLFGQEDAEAEVYKYARNFRRQLKARLLSSQIVTQIVRETTLCPDDFQRADGKRIRGVEDAATVAWKICTTSYYKSGGRPWQLAGVRPGVCYVGLVYKEQPQTSDVRWACCAAQMFLSNAEGIVFRGALGPWFNPETRQFHLDAEAAHGLVSMVLTEYRQAHGRLPSELFIHAKTSFSDEEWAGFASACGTETNVVGVQIADGWDQLKLFRPGAYPVLRGTAMAVSPRSAYLWTSGYVPRLDTYMGPETPNPLFIKIHRGNGDLTTVLRDVMGLTKVNFNTCLFNDRSPVTIRFADAIGDILVAAPVPDQPKLPFKFYI
jgi:hypothetical protein